jgi:WD40 repeat protein
LFAKLAFKKKYRFSDIFFKSIKIWNAYSGQLLNTLTSFKKHISVDAIAILSDDLRIVSGDGNGNIGICDTQTDQLLNTWAGHTGLVRKAVTCIVVTSNNKDIITGSEDGYVKIWNAYTSNLVTFFWVDTVINCMAITSNNQKIVVGDYIGNIKQLDILTGKLFKYQIGHTSTVYSVAISLDDLRIVSGSRDKSVKIWDVQSGSRLKTLNAHTSSVHSVTFSSDNLKIASGDDDHSINLWDAVSGQLLNTLHDHTKVRCVAFLPNSLIIVSSSHECIKIWDAVSGQLLNTLVGHTEAIMNIAISKSIEPIDVILKKFVINKNCEQQSLPTKIDSQKI